MPIEIRELVIRATVRDSEESSAPSSSAASDQQTEKAERLLAQVSEMLRKRRER